MIAELRVRDLATIADVTLEFGEGLNVLSGETGAGKSMLVDALALLLGERADSQLVRPGSSRTIIEGVFDVARPSVRDRIEALGLDFEDQRAHRPTGDPGRRPLAGVDQRQSHHRFGAGPGRRPAGRPSWTTRDAVAAPRRCPARYPRCLWSRRRRAGGGRRGDNALTDLRRREEELIARRDEVRRRAVHRHVVQEIDDARIKPGEDEQLQQEARRLGHAVQLVDLAGRIAAAIDGEKGNALAALTAADRALTALENRPRGCRLARDAGQRLHQSLRSSGAGRGDMLRGSRKIPVA